MAEYAILHINKLKTTKSLVQSSNHNFRKVLASNIDREKIKDNRQLKGESDASYAKLFKQAIKESDYYKNHDIAKNAVMGYEVLLTLSREMKDDVDIDKWSSANVEWLEEEFGKDNVKNAVLHLDEETPHIHAYVVPMMENGKLSSSKFIDGKKGLTKLQDSYADRMSEFGLSRGIKKSRAKRQEIKDFYRRIDEALEYSENIRDYATRREDETEEECIERLISAVSDMAMKVKKDEEELKEKDRKLQQLSKNIDEIENLTNIVLGDEFSDMVRYALANGKDKKMVDVFKKILIWASEEYEEYKQSEQKDHDNEDVGDL